MGNSIAHAVSQDDSAILCQPAQKNFSPTTDKDVHIVSEVAKDICPHII